MKGKRALILAGAGASFAVSKDKYPTTVQFFHLLEEKVAKDPLIELIGKKLDAKFGDGSPDVEKILWCLDELHHFSACASDSSHPVNWVTQKDRFAELLGAGEGFRGLGRLLASAAARVNRLRDDIYRQVYDLYSSAPKENELADNWLYLIEKLRRRNFWLDLVTTNYDLVIEQAIHYSKELVSYGKSGGVIEDLTTDTWKAALSDESQRNNNAGLLTKLHGSVNWHRDKHGVVFAGTDYLGSPNRHAVIYPGFKGVPSDEPFDLFHTYFESALQWADVILVIGFAFRDDYINQCLDRNARGKTVFVINPAKPVGVPAQVNDQLVWINSGFDRSAVDLFDSHLSRVASD